MWIKFKAKEVEFDNSVYCLIPDSIVQKEEIKEGEEVMVSIRH